MTVAHDNIHGNFSPVAEAYTKGRHEYPAEVLAWCKKMITGKTVLDVGCGTGISTRQLAHIGYAVTGTDVSETMIAKALQESPKIPYFIAKTEALPFPNHQFDGVTAFTAFHWFNTRKATNEIKRILKPDHPFCVIHGMPGKGLDDPVHHRPIVEHIVGRKLPNAYEHFDPKKDLKKFGFSRVSSELFTYTERRSIEEFLIYWQTVSLWNYIPVNKRAYALDLFREHLHKNFLDGIVSRLMTYHMVVGYNFPGHI